MPTGLMSPCHPSYFRGSRDPSNTSLESWVVFSLWNGASLVMFWVSIYSSPTLWPESSSREKKKKKIGERCILVILGIAKVMLEKEVWSIFRVAERH